MINITITVSMAGPDKIKVCYKCPSGKEGSSPQQAVFNYVMAAQMEDFLRQCKTEAERLIRVMKHEGRFEQVGKANISSQKLHKIEV